MNYFGVCVVDLCVKGWIQIVKIFFFPGRVEIPCVFVYDMPNTAQFMDWKGKTEYRILCYCSGDPHITGIRNKEVLL